MSSTYHFKEEPKVKINFFGGLKVEEIF